MPVTFVPVTSPVNKPFAYLANVLRAHYAICMCLPEKLLFYLHVYTKLKLERSFDYESATVQMSFPEPRVRPASFARTED